MEHVRNYFSKLFSIELLSSPLSVASDDLGCPQISSSECHYLSLPVTDEEIKNALWSRRLSSPLVLTDCTLDFFKDSGWWLVNQYRRRSKKSSMIEKFLWLSIKLILLSFQKTKAWKPLEISDLLVYATLSTRLLLRLLWPELDLF